MGINTRDQWRVETRTGQGAIHGEYQYWTPLGPVNMFYGSVIPEGSIKVTSKKGVDSGAPIQLTGTSNTQKDPSEDLLNLGAATLPEDPSPRRSLENDPNEDLMPDKSLNPEEGKPYGALGLIQRGPLNPPPEGDMKASLVKESTPEEAFTFYRDFDIPGGLKP